MIGFISLIFWENHPKIQCLTARPGALFGDAEGGQGGETPPAVCPACTDLRVMHGKPSFPAAVIHFNIVILDFGALPNKS